MYVQVLIQFPRARIIRPVVWPSFMQILFAWNLTHKTVKSYWSLNSRKDLFNFTTFPKLNYITKSYIHIYIHGAIYRMQSKRYKIIYMVPSQIIQNLNLILYGYDFWIILNCQKRYPRRLIKCLTKSSCDYGSLSHKTL